jgi:integrase
LGRLDRPFFMTGSGQGYWAPHGHKARAATFDWGNIRLKKYYRVKETLGFPITLHQLRHAAASHLLVNGAPLRAVQELLGHRDPNSTQIYTHITPIYLSAVHDRCHPRNSGVWPKEDEELAGNS